VTGTVFDIQHYAVHDGPGIRTLVFLKGCPLRCAWCCNPESRSGNRELKHRHGRCRGCLHCTAACPHGAVSRVDGETRFDRRRCASCVARLCVDACPENALEVVGSTVSVAELVARVAKDLAFYRNSGGGVTFSGGEPFAQTEFLLAALAACRDAGIHTAVETCGHADPALVAAAQPLVDLFLYDVKVVDADRHRALTGVDNRLIMENLRHLADADPARIVLRVPLVPGATDDDANLAAIADLARSIGVTRIDIEPYHSLGHGKYLELGLPSPETATPHDPAELARIATWLTGSGLDCQLA
jgi:pyruvate formate lyase activating enzyme